jgi:hypothetical protein
MEENHGNNTFAVADTICLNLDGGESNPDTKSAAHAHAGSEEQRATANFVNEETPEPGFE